MTTLDTEHDDQPSAGPWAPLLGAAGGRWVVTTRNGTKHILDLDAKTSIRLPGKGREWTAEQLSDWLASTGDGVPFRWERLTFFFEKSAGWLMHLDNDEEWRRTSTIRSIEALMDAT